MKETMLIVSIIGVANVQKNDQQTYLNQLDAKEKCIHKDALFIMQQMGDNSRVADVSAGHDVVNPKQITLVNTIS